ncbi:MAG: [protein-PII] uridylyltransferase [Desulfobulbaceae bacterium]|jgi:[protein-PII] uridylyltransferase|nr:[protein-PII] uridylyltransferase [Desulfobulbaceae bacterium]
MKSELRSRRKALETLWQKGLSGQTLLEEHTTLVDSSLNKSFRNCKTDTSDIALVALGGYGRKELFPFSDIDIMILYREGAEERLNAIAEAVFYPLWDAGLEVGHGVRTPAICIDDAHRDFFFQVALLDARLLTGNTELFAELLNEYTKTFIDGQRKPFFENMVSHCKLRHARFGNHSYLLEPHIKESRGGFRDIQAMLWSAQVVFGIKNLEDMESSGFLSPQERLKLEEATHNLIRIRNRLHYISGRKNDQLFFEHQEDMAEAFAYKNTKAILGVELFMHDVHHHLQVVAIATDLFFEHVQDVVGLKLYTATDTILEEGIELRQGRIQITRPELLQKRFHLLMRVFSQSAKTGHPIHHRTKQLISQHLELIEKSGAKSKRVSQAFQETLQAKNSLAVLTDMLETGILSAFIPEFEHLESLAQHDVYHVYTVDRHLLQTVDELNTLREEEGEIFARLQQPVILFLAGLLHDIGKGTHQDHSDYGAKLILTIGERIGLSPEAIDTLVFLVKNHLYLPAIALRRDIEDEELIMECAQTIKTPDRLAMLFLLTTADARATGPTVWTEWKSALLQELFLRINHALEHKETETPDQEDAVEWMRQQLIAQLNQNQETSFDIGALPDDYLISFTTDEVMSHINLHTTTLQKTASAVVATDHGIHWQLLIMAQDQRGILNRICGILALHNIQVLSAKIFTWENGTVVDSLNVTSSVDKKFSDHDWEALHQDLNRAIHQRIGINYRLSQKPPPLSRKAAPTSDKRSKPKVIITPDGSAHHTIIEVFAEDKTALLYNVTRTLTDLGLSTHKAQITTQGDQVVDVFYVQDNGGHKIHDKEYLQEIKLALTHATKGLP